MTALAARLLVPSLAALASFGAGPCTPRPEPVPPGSGTWAVEWGPDVEAALVRLERNAVDESEEEAAGAPAASLRAMGYLGEAGDDAGDALYELDEAQALSADGLLDAYRGPGDVAPPGKDGARTAQTWRRAGAPANAVTLRVGDDDVLPLLGVEAAAWVHGMRARVLLDCVFENTFERQLEGNFKLRLPEGASPYYFAFGAEVWSGRDDGQAWTLPERDRSLAQGPEPELVGPSRDAHWSGAREARMVPRAAAAKAYKDTVRRSVDPALMEWAGAGVFQARVFPLAPNAVHRIVVGYEVDLVAVGGELVFALDFPDDLAALSLDLWSAMPVGAAVRIAPASDIAIGGGRTHASYPATDERRFELRVPEPEGLALVSDEGTGVFAMDLVPDLEGPDLASGNDVGSPVGLFLVDTSLSAAERMPVQLDLLTAILDANRETLREFAVLTFDVAPHWWRAELTPNTPAEVAALRADLEALALEGATDLDAALRAAAAPAWSSGAPNRGGPAWDLFLLSDGAPTWGEADLEFLAERLRAGPAGPLFAYTTGQAGTDRRVLQHLTRESGGALFSVAGPGDLAAAATAHRGRPYTIEALSVAGGRDLLLRGRPTGVFPGQRLRLVGRGLLDEGDVVELVLASPSGERVAQRFPVTHPVASPLAARAYGEVATALLEESGRATREAAQAFATRFRVPGRACSLLMLETDADYAEHGILPEEVVAAAVDREAGAAASAARADLVALRADPARRFLELLAPLLDTPAAGSGNSVNAVEVEDGSGLVVAVPEDVLSDDALSGTAVAPPTLALDPDFVQRLSALPASAWTLEPEPLRTATRYAADMPPEFIADLRSGEPDYLALQAEAQRRRAELELGDALRALSSLVELSPGDAVVARDVAQTLTAWGLYGHAYHLTLRVAEARPFEPQSYLALARCAEAAGRGDLALAWYTVAVDGQWDARFGDFRDIATFDSVHCLRRIERGELEADLAPWAAPRALAAFERLGRREVGLAIAIQWNTDATDVDLHVLEPTEEHCFYSHRETELGGRLSRDVTQGYGPELYLLPEPAAGEYVVWARFFSGDPNRTEVRTKVLATVYRDWGTEREELERVELVLESARDQHGIARLVLAP